jgi:hypothetical protein
MVDDLKRDSIKWRSDQDRRSRSGRTTGTPDSHRILPREGSNTFGSVSYAEMKGRQEADFGDTMEVDDYAHEPMSRHYDPDPRDRHGSGRHATIPVTSGAYQDSRQAYSISTGPPSKYGPEGVPRYGGGSTPPTSRPMASEYGQTSYPSRTSAQTATSLPANAYRDPRTGQIVSGGYDSGYGDSGRSRHGR